MFFLLVLIFIERVSIETRCYSKRETFTVTRLGHIHSFELLNKVEHPFIELSIRQEVFYLIFQFKIILSPF